MVVRIKPSLTQCDDSIHASHGQFRLLVRLVLIFFGLGMGWSALVDVEYLKNESVAELCFQFAKDLFLVALGMFRGMSPDPEKKQPKKG